MTTVPQPQACSVLLRKQPAQLVKHLVADFPQAAARPAEANNRLATTLTLAHKLAAAPVVPCAPNKMQLKNVFPHLDHATLGTKSEAIDVYEAAGLARRCAS